MGGMVAAIERGFPQMEIGNAAYRYQKEVESDEQIVVGVNKYIVEEEDPIPTLTVDPSVEQIQITNVQSIKSKRNQTKVDESLAALEACARTEENVMPKILDCVRNYASLGEISDVFRRTFGEYHDPKWL